MEFVTFPATLIFFCFHELLRRYYLRWAQLISKCDCVIYLAYWANAEENNVISRRTSSQEITKRCTWTTFRLLIWRAWIQDNATSHYSTPIIPTNYIFHHLIMFFLAKLIFSINRIPFSFPTPSNWTKYIQKRNR